MNNHSDKNRLWHSPLTLMLVVSLMMTIVVQLGVAQTKVKFAPLSDQNWTLIFQDDFQGTKLNADYWQTQYWFGRTNKGNRELEWYQDDSILVQNGLLRLRADKKAVADHLYTSGIISSHDKVSFTYGYVEARVRIPKGDGLWPAFWLLPASKTWPPEIDIFELKGNQTDTAHFHIHYVNSSQKPMEAGSTWTGPNFAADWHLFATDWEPGSITWYVDNVERWHYEGSGIPDEPMYLVANLAVGGTWPGPPTAKTKFPSYFDISYIRVWQRSSDLINLPSLSNTP